jgi:uncharacterized membrane protein YhdT
MSEQQTWGLDPAFKGPMVTVSMLFILLPVMLNLIMLPRILGLPNSMPKWLAMSVLVLPLVFSAGMFWLLRTTLKETRLVVNAEGIAYYSPLLSLKASWDQAEALIPSDVSAQRWNLKLSSPAEILNYRLLRPPEAGRQQIPLFPFVGLAVEPLEKILQGYSPNLKRQKSD